MQIIDTLKCRSIHQTSIENIRLHSTNSENKQVIILKLTMIVGEGIFLKLFKEWEWLVFILITIKK